MRWKQYTWQILVALFLVLNILYPSRALMGAKAGLQIFLETVLPALLPFFAATTMFVRSGLAHKLAYALSPLMRPLFRLPGASALAFVLCLFGGNPNGSRVTSELYEQGLLSKMESERTVALASTAGPAFIFSVVIGELLKAPQYGALLWVCHILSAIATCQLSSLFVSKSQISRDNKKTAVPDSRQSPSQIFVESVRDCAISLWGVGSFIIFFSTLTGLCQSIGLFELLAKPLGYVIRPLGFSSQLAEPLIRGIMEITDGCYAVSAVSVPITEKLPFICAIISFGGFSALAQNYLFAKKCGMRISRLTLYYTIQGLLGLFFTTVAVRTVPVAQAAFAPVYSTFDGKILNSSAFFLYAIAVLICLGIVLGIISKVAGMINSKQRPTRIDS